MLQHAVELFKWNKKINLTAIKDPFEMAEKHFIDSILCYGQISDSSSIVDIGSGGGFPGIPIKILMPDTTVFMVDSSRKKVNFLKHVIRICNLNRIEAIHTRVEDLARDMSHNGKYDIAISRAFTQLPQLIDKAFPLIKNGGSIIALKSKNVFNEMDNKIKKQFNIETKKHILPFEKSSRYIIKINAKS